MHRIRRAATSASRGKRSGRLRLFRRAGTVSASQDRLHDTQPDSHRANTLTDSHRANTLTREAGGTDGRPSRTIAAQLRSSLCKWINVLLVFVPAGIATHYAGVDPTVVFVLNFVAIVPLAALLSVGTEEIALYSGDVVGGLLNATFGNAVELIVSVLALVKREIVIVQTSLIGSILSNLLLVLGMAFVAGGFNRSEQKFNTTIASTAASMLTVSCASLIVPTAFHMASTTDTDAGIAELSRGTSVILLLVYASYLVFQLKTHEHLYAAASEKTPTEKLLRRRRRDGAAPEAEAEREGEGEGEGAAGDEGAEDAADEPELTLVFALVLLAVSTALVALCAECLVSSIDHLVERSGVSRVFVGLILLPIVGNAAEHATAVTVAAKDKMDLSIGVAVGSSMQIALLVVPLTVILGWCLGISAMNLYFDGFQVTILFAAVLLVNYLIVDGRSNYLEGIMLIALYLIIALASWFYPKEGALAGAIEA